jgi:hypothetical protein
VLRVGCSVFLKNMAIWVHASVFLFLEKIGGWAGRDLLRAVQRRCGMVDGRKANSTLQRSGQAMAG